MSRLCNPVTVLVLKLFYSFLKITLEIKRYVTFNAKMNVTLQQSKLKEIVVIRKEEGMQEARVLDPFLWSRRVLLFVPLNSGMCCRCRAYMIARMSEM